METDDKEVTTMDNELTDELISDLYHLPFSVVEKSLFYDSIDIKSDIVGWCPQLRSVDYRVEMLMLVVVRSAAVGDNDIIEVPIRYEHNVMSDQLRIPRDILISIEVSNMDRSISEFIKEQLNSIRSPTRHIEQVTFRRNPKLISGQYNNLK